MKSDAVLLGLHPPDRLRARLPMKWKILNTAKPFMFSGENGVRMLEGEGCEIVATGRPCPLSAADLRAELPGVDAVVAGSDDFCAALLEAPEASDLKIIQRWGVGHDAIDVPAATGAGIVVGYLPGFLDDVVADYTWALMLGMARRIPWGQASMLEGTWQPSWGHDVVHRTLGIVGCAWVREGTLRYAGVR